ncbi:MAG TPA: hypothetical protein P5141_06675, partial [Candidatus Hydrogenedentes bacterium]|nr:hypothetical protein [Candidatus Hydrogenedentota bacterium]
ELVQIFAGQHPDVWPTPAQALFQHWSAGFTPVNLYPYLTFPLLAVAGELLYRRVRSTPPDGGVQA